MPCVTLTQTKNTLFSRLSQEKALRTCCFTSTWTKNLSGPLTGFVIGQFVLCQAYHSDKDPLWRHSSGDSLYQTVWQRSWQKNGNLGKCVCVHRRKYIYTACVCGTEEEDVLEKSLLHRMCWLYVCECVSLLVGWPPCVCFGLCAVHLPTVRPQSQQT